MTRRQTEHTEDFINIKIKVKTHVVFHIKNIYQEYHKIT